MRPTTITGILTRFDAVQVLTAEARLTRTFPGGPITALFIARQGPDAAELGRFTLTTSSSDGLDAMYDTAVRQIDEIYALGLRTGRLQSEPDLAMELAPLVSSGPAIGAPIASGEDSAAASANIEVAMATPDSATASNLEALLRATSGVTSVTITSLSLSGTSRVLISYDVARESLDHALDGNGLRLVNENGQTVLRRRLPQDAPVPAPRKQAEIAPRSPANDRLRAASMPAAAQSAVPPQ